MQIPTNFMSLFVKQDLQLRAFKRHSKYLLTDAVKKGRREKLKRLFAEHVQIGSGKFSLQIKNIFTVLLWKKI